MRILKNIAYKVYGKDADKIFGSMDVIGDIAIIKIPNEILDERRFEYGQEIIRNISYIKTVLRQRTPVEGVLRVRKFEYLAGERKTETLYKEHGALFVLDVEKVYFSPRLSNERKRILDLIDSGEIVVNMFAGVGPFSILIARNVDRIKVHSIDINPIAIEYHLLNNILNKVEEKIITYRGDAAFVIPKYLNKVADRVLMPLPEYAIRYLDYALYSLKDYGTLHIYLHIPYRNKENEAIEKAIEIIKDEIIDRQYAIVEIYCNRVREVGPRLLQVCVDVSVKRKG